MLGKRVEDSTVSRQQYGNYQHSQDLRESLEVEAMTGKRRSHAADDYYDDGDGGVGLGVLMIHVQWQKTLGLQSCSFDEDGSTMALRKTMAPSTRGGARRTIFHPCR